MRYNVIGIIKPKTLKERRTNLELISINENKLKIIMTVSDMERVGLDEDDFHLSLINTRSILKKILNASPLKTGFEELLPSDKILLQMYPEADGGCELFITKLSLDNTSDLKEDLIVPIDEEKRLLPEVTKKTTEYKKAPLTYSFGVLEHAIRACKELKNRNFEGDSSFYLHNCGKYFLFLTKSTASLYDTTSYIAEFGELENSENAILSVLERGKKIFDKNAVENLASL
jgi:negative regulator of genetic competence, sporulation and motility